MDLDKLRALILAPALCVLAMLASPTDGAEPAAVNRKYAFELVTLNLSATSRSRRDPTAGGRMRIDVASSMTEEELETVTRMLDQVQASQPDGAGYRHFSLPNGTRGRIGSFSEDPEVAGAGVDSLQMELEVADELSTTDAALVLRIAVAANLFVARPDDPTVVATTYAVTDRPFLREHPRATVTLDDAALAEWIRQNIPVAAVAGETGR